MTANDIHLLTGAYVLGSLDDTDRDVFTRHLDGCEGCAGEVAELRETVVRLADDSWAVPPPRLRQNVLEQIRNTRQLPPVKAIATQPRHAQPSAWRKRTAYGLAAAILAVVAGGGTFLVQESRVRDAQRQQIQAAERAAKIEAVLTAPDASVKTTDILGGGKVTVISAPSRNAAVALLAGTDPGPDKAYEFWMLEKGNPRPAAVLPAGDQSGTTLIEGLGNTDTIAMTREKAGGATIPSDPILAAVTMT